MEKKNEVKLLLVGLVCANCGNKIEANAKKVEGVKEANLNFTTATLNIELIDNKYKDEVIKKIKQIVNKFEPDVKVVEKNTANIKRNQIKQCTSSTCNVNDTIKEETTHEHEHNHDKIEKFNIKDNIKLIMGIIVYVLAMLIQGNEYIKIALFAGSYVLIGGEVVITAIKNIFRGELFDENFLMTIATVGAFIIGEYPEGVAVMLFYEIGELFQGYAVNRSRKSITSLMNIRADYANVLRNNLEEKVSPEQIEIGELIIVKPGERVPLDGIVIEGKSFLDTSALTGESVPRQITENDEILAGCINNNGVLKVKVLKKFGESTVSRILELVENASNKKAKTEKFITKFSKVYTPIVVVLALLLAIIPPLIISEASFYDWLYRALIFLVVSCPCALVVSVPLGLFAGIGGASKKGVLVKGGNYLEALKDVDTVVFDKTGTLTKGVFNVTQINAVNIKEDELLELAAYGEALSNHPIAQSIVNKYAKNINKEILKDYEEISGNGIKVLINNKLVLIGNYKLMKKFNIQYNEEMSIGTVVHIALENEYKGNIIISDEIKENSINAIKKLKSLGIKKTVMLTGDNKVVADKVSKITGIDQVYSELLPTDKVLKIEDILNDKGSNKKVAFVGDGINDAPVLARADIGVAMGGIGSDAAIEAADVVLMKDDPESLVTAIKVAKKTSKILWQNIIFSLGIKILVLVLGAFGIATMWEAVFADVGVTALAVLNSTRCLK